MNTEHRIEFVEASQAFLCDEYYKNNFTAFLHAKSVIVDSSERYEPPEFEGPQNLFLLKLEEGSQPLKQEQADALIELFLAADAENKAQNK